ncbi:uncharacterized protein LOC128987667 isoform X1 [Macrosteles quadrilineatus]|uniref:uncharacterized protein LOC128987667 isoform X1 n=1 Tax=Macrosteles quadrilineatus TaxID=74068 RepID=UPI0023E255DA|nr:uncharacterized protein LOC128987667 isoform X1 [Macrosteles quadrilineatus]
MRLKNLVHKNPRTSTSSFDTLSKDVEGYFTSKQTNFDTKCGSETTFTPSITKGKHGLNSDIIRENKNKTHLMKPLNQGAENEEESNQILVKTTISKGNKEFEQSSINKLVGSKISSHIKPEDTITRSPFKVKYLMRFKNFKSSTQHCPSDSTLLSLASSENYEKDTPVTKENFNFDITTKPMSAVNIHFDSKTSNPTCNNTAKHKVMKNNPTTTKGFEGLGSLETSEHTDNTLVVSTQIYEDIRGLRKSTEYDLRRYKYPGRIENHNYNNRKLDNSASDSFKEMFNVTVHTNSGDRFRDWFLGKNKIPAINKTYNKKDNCTFRWCFQLSSTNNITVTKPLPSYVTTETPVQSSEEHLIQSTFAPNKKIKHFFHLKHSHNTLPLIVSENNTVVDSALSDVTKEYIHNSNAPETSTRRGGKDNTLNVNLIPYNYDTTTNENQRGTLSNRTQIEFAFTTEPNMSVNKTGRGKVKQFFHKFYTDKIHVIKLNKTNSLQQENSTALTKSVAFADNVESKVETKKHEFYPNITDVRNAADINDTSFNVMAFVMKPFDSLVGVFKALSPNSITKIGDVNATDIKNGSLPDHLQPPNSSIVILAVNNTNATSKDIHESNVCLCC